LKCIGVENKNDILLSQKSALMLHVCKALFILSLILVFSCSDTDYPAVDSKVSWDMVWSDEFDGDSLQQPDTTIWTFDIGRGNNGWGNGELQYYTDRTENVFIDGAGHLVIRAFREDYKEASYTSARLKTKRKVEQKYGKFEARIQAPTGMGIWPAFWMLGSNIDSVGWPVCGEIDIMEVIGEERNEIHGSLHGPGHSAGEAITTTYTLPKGQMDEDFHIFSVEWDADSIVFFVDNQPYQTVRKSRIKGKWVYNTPFFMLLNLAIGGTYVGFPTAETPFPKEMIIDYVRVYERTESEEEKEN